MAKKGAADKKTAEKKAGDKKGKASDSSESQDKSKVGRPAQSDQVSIKCHRIDHTI